MLLMIQKIIDSTPVLSWFSALLIVIGLVFLCIGFACLQQKRSER